MAEDEVRVIDFKFNNPVGWYELTSTIMKYLPEEGIVGAIEWGHGYGYYIRQGDCGHLVGIHVLTDIIFENDRGIDRDATVRSAKLFTITAPNDLADRVNAALQAAA